MKQFNLDEYLRLKEAGKEPKIVTRDGRSVRIVCTDMKNQAFPVVAVYPYDDKEGCVCYTASGRYSAVILKHPLDLFFADPEPIYRPYKTLEEVIEAIKEHGNYIKDGNTVRILKKFTLMEDGSIRYKFSDYVESGRAWEELCKRITWAADGAPFGVKED